MTGERGMKSVEFRREREATWHELESLVQAAEKHGLGSLTGEQLARLPHLYRASLSSLSVARSISLDRALVVYLESLVGRAYFVVYGTRQRLRSTISRFLRHRFPQAVRDARWHVMLAIVLVVVGALAAYRLTSQDQDLYYSFVGDMAGGRTPASTTKELHDGLYASQSFSDALGTFAAQLFNNNARVGILAFALGFVAGIPTLALLFYNGLVLGAFVALYTSRGLSADIWGWLLPHGITELGAVFLCGAAGFKLAYALVFPGARPRLDNLRTHGRDAAVIVAGAIGMLFIAGLIEGIMRQTITNIGVRYAFATFTAIFWLWYFGWCGRASALEEDVN
jgi:uncharacterized membrane protein SpoIIM required for sporulation